MSAGEQNVRGDHLARLADTANPTLARAVAAVQAERQDHHSSHDLGSLRTFSEELIELSMRTDDDADGELLIRIAAKLRTLARSAETPS